MFLRAAAAVTALDDGPRGSGRRGAGPVLPGPAAGRIAVAVPAAAAGRRRERRRSAALRSAARISPSAPDAATAQPPRTYEPEALPPPGPYGQPRPAIRRARAGLCRRPASTAPLPPRPMPPPAAEPAYGSAARQRAASAAPAGRPRYRAVPPAAVRTPASVRRWAIGAGPAGASIPTSRRACRRTIRPETGPRKELPPQFRRTTVDYRTREPAGTIVDRHRRTRISISCSATARRCATASASAAKASPGRAPSASPAWPSGRTGIRRRR